MEGPKDSPRMSFNTDNIKLTPQWVLTGGQAGEVPGQQRRPQ